MKGNIEITEIDRGDGWEFYAKSSPKTNFGRAKKEERKKKTSVKKEVRYVDTKRERV